MGNKLFVGNISWDATKEDIQTLFSQIGTVEDVYLVYDKIKNRPKGFGFVTMSTEEEAQKAMEELDGADLVGRPIRVSEAKPREERPAPAGDSDGGMGGGMGMAA